MPEYMLERKEPYSMEGINRQLTSRVLTHRWKQVAKSNSIDKLKGIVLGNREDYRIVDWNTLEIIPVI